MADKTIRVKSALPQREDGGWPTAFWEVDPAHPKTKQQPDGGEAFVAGPDPVTVAPTGAVMGALRDGRLELVDGGDEDVKDAAEAGEAERPALVESTAAAEAPVRRR